MTEERRPKLSDALSVYLDLVRFLAAVVVVLYHAWPILFPNSDARWPGHEAVVVFFVLSGLVIAYSVQKPGLRFWDYTLHRYARIWSVALPALALSGFVSLITRGQALGAAAPGTDSLWIGIKQLSVNSASLGQIWFANINPPTNGPFWSLNFEILYYWIFGAWVFLTGWLRPTLIFGIALLAGPKILTLLPIWLLGAALCKYQPRLRDRTALIVFSGSIVLIAGYLWFDLNHELHEWARASLPGLWRVDVPYSFVGDWILAPLVAINFGAAAELGRYATCLRICRKPIRVLSNVTFSTYLYHMPLLVLACLALDLSGIPALLFVAVSIVLLAQVTECKLPETRKLLRWCLTSAPHLKRPQL